MADIDYPKLEVVGVKDAATGTVQFGVNIDGGLIVLATLKQGYVDGRIAAAELAAPTKSTARSSKG